MTELHDWQEFKIFAQLHPIEAYDSRPDDFCRFMHEQGHGMTNDEIRELIESCR